jgi:hypothetical protein
MRTYWARRETAGKAISSSRRGLYAAAIGLAAGFSLIWSSSAAAAEACPNEALRTGPSAQLPDCRAYELASPLAKNGLDVITDGPRASSTGAGIVFETQGALPGSPSAGLLTFNLARRDADGGGWTTEPVSATMNPFFLPSLAPMPEWAPDLSRAIVQASSNSPLSPDSQPGAQDLYLRDTATGAFSLVSHSPGFPGLETEPDYRGASEDLSHVVYNNAQNETADPDLPVQPGAKVLYEGVNGEVRVVGVLPNGDLADSGAVLGSGRVGLGTRDAVSADGSRIVFTTATEAFGITPPGLIHVRIDGTSTVFVSGSQRAGDDPTAPTPPATYSGATRDGSAVFFTSPAELTDDATTGGGAGRDLYRFDVDDETLVDLAPSPDDPNGAEVQGVVGTSDDGSHVYFVANATLDGDNGIDGQPNLYLWREGTIEFIATLSPLDADANWNNAPFEFGDPPPTGSRVSADGTEALITTVSAQDGFDNAGHGEIYRYSTTPAPSWTCVSCNRLGEPATADATLSAPTFPIFGNLNPGYLNRALSSGEDLVFFNSGDQLIAEDENDVVDAYRWHDGELSLISAGEGEFPSFFLDADTFGDNAYIATRDRLVPEDTDNLLDVYDVRVNGGIPAQPGPPGCGAEPCRGPSPGPGSATEPGTANFAGPGNPKPRIKKHCHRKRGKRPLCHWVRHKQPNAGRTNRG